MIEKCRICGDTVPPGKDLCWCCEHGPKLHSEKPKQTDSDQRASNGQKTEVTR